MSTGETEFGGTGGLVAARTMETGTENVQQQVWEVYATNEGTTADDPAASVNQQARLGRVGRKPPRESYTPGGGLPGKGQ